MTRRTAPSGQEPANAGSRATTRLPGELTSFIGRIAELEQLEALLRHRRLVTLTGPGGCGKSRLAARACLVVEDSAPRHDGVRWVDFGSVTDPALVPRTIAEAVGVLVDPGDQAAADLIGQLQDNDWLICLDTCEHLLESISSLVDRLLRDCPELVVVATSREPLGVPGETVFRVPNLAPGEAIALFFDRATLADPDYDPGEQDVEVRRICDGVDRIPLAVELAAAWVPTLAARQIADGLDDSLQLLGGGPRTALPRHQTMTASLDWSHQLLQEAEQRVFRRLAIFSGTFSGEAASDVAGHDLELDESRVGREAGPRGRTELAQGETLGLLRRLVEKSFVTARNEGGDVRYRLLDVARQYAHAKLAAAGESESTRDRHLDFYADLARRAKTGFDTDQDLWRSAMVREQDQVHAALRWALRPGSPDRLERGRHLATAMSRQWFIRGQSQEGLDFLHRALELEPEADTATQAQLHTARAMLGMVAGRVDLIDESVPIAELLATEVGDRKSLALATALRAYKAFFVDAEKCFEAATEAAQLAEEAGEPFARDLASMLAGYSLTRRDRHGEALAVSVAAYERSIARNDRFCATFARGVELFAHLYTGDVRRAVTIGDQMMALVEPLGDYFGYGSNATNVALARGMSGDIQGARRTMESVVRSIDGLVDVDVVGYMFTYGMLTLWAGEPEKALDWFTRGVDLEASFEWTAVRCRPNLAAALRRLGRLDEAAAAATRAVEVAGAVGGRYVLAEAWDEQAKLVTTTDMDPAKAYDLHHRALALRREFGLRTFYPDSLDALGALSAHHGNAPETAVRMLAASGRARDDMGYPRTPAGEPEHQQAVAALRAVLGDDQFAACWEEGTAQTLDEAVAAASRGRGPNDRPDIGWSSLTPTELDVARMVAEGLTNPEIGRRLFISRSTVKTHLSNVYRKLAISSRAELASMVGRSPTHGGA